MNGERRFVILRCLTGATCLLGAGCASSHAVHYYTLGAAAPHASPSLPDGPTILVANLSASPSLEDFRIRYRSGANQEGAYEFHHWTEQPGVMIRDALMQALRSSGKYRRVLEASSSAAGDYLVRGRLHQFHEVDSPAIQTRIALRLVLIDKKTNRMIWDHLFERDEPAGGKSIPEVVASMDRNLAQIAAQASAEIGQIIATSAPTSPAVH